MKILSANAFNLNKAKILLSGKELTCYHTILAVPGKKPFEHIVGKGENADNQHFLLFQQCFLPYQRKNALLAALRLSSASTFNLDRSKTLLSGKELTFYHTIPTFNDPEKEAFRKHLGKGENVGNQHFLLFPHCFLPIPKRISVFN